MGLLFDKLGIQVTDEDLVENYTAEELRDVAIDRLGANQVAAMSDEDIAEWYNLGV